MIEYLRIENLALLERAEIDFTEGFTAVTGETGAGKSVLLGALAMLSGARCGKEAVGGHSDTCRVEAVLRFKDTSKIDKLLESSGLPPCEDGTLLISRVVGISKPSRAFVNSSPAPLSFLSKLGGYWIDFHGPGEPQKLFSRKNQLEMLDTFAGDSQLLEEYMRIYSERRQMLSNIESLSQTKSLGEDEIEFLRSRIAAIDAVNPTEESIAELEEKSKLAEAASDIVEKSSAVAEAIDGDGGILEKLAAASKFASEISRFSAAAESLSERLRGVGLELADISSEYGNLARSSNMDEAQIETVRRKMTDWLGLCRKFGNSVESVLSARREMAAKIENQSDVRATMEKLRRRADELLESLVPIAEKILKAREKAAKKLAERASKTLLGLGFKNARFDISISAESEPSPDCGSSCEFMFMANPGQPLLPLAKIASSGELARVMLALKTTLADADATPLLVFDEVDANVGGEIGAEVGKRLAELSKGHQVFCVTHLPQVAACANGHFLVEKFQTKTSTSVSIARIDGDKKRRVSELARMLGDRNSESAVAHAQKLLDKKF
ncbi:MAG TPA: DNA repair protein RecN [Candidatus Merdousia gallistercoris]|nr:DNA repair protein RecN [Candidatus Merdousia gallistercoris]